MRYNERASRGLIEEDHSKLKHTWIAIQNQRDKTIVEQICGAEADGQDTAGDRKAVKSKSQKDLKNKDIMVQRKGLDRADAEKYYHLKIGNEFKQVVNEGSKSPAADLGHSRQEGSQSQTKDSTKFLSKSVEKMYEFEEFQKSTSYKA